MFGLAWRQCFWNALKHADIVWVCLFKVVSKSKQSCMAFFISRKVQSFHITLNSDIRFQLVCLYGAFKIAEETEFINVFFYVSSKSRALQIRTVVMVIPYSKTLCEWQLFFGAMFTLFNFYIIRIERNTTHRWAFEQRIIRYEKVCNSIQKLVSEYNALCW